MQRWRDHRLIHGQRSCFEQTGPGHRLATHQVASSHFQLVGAFVLRSAPDKVGPRAEIADSFKSLVETPGAVPIPNRIATAVAMIDAIHLRTPNDRGSNGSAG